jgi:hypothetical protein
VFSSYPSKEHEKICAFSPEPYKADGSSPKEGGKGLSVNEILCLQCNLVKTLRHLLFL